MVFGTLEISTWRGVSVGAIHWYGKLHIDAFAYPTQDECIALTRKLTNAEVRAANLEAGWGICKVGETTEGFNTKEDAVNAGLQRFKSNYKGVLFEGQNACLSAWKNIIYYSAPHLKPVVDEMNALAKEFQSLNGYEGNSPKRVERLDKKWFKRYSLLRNLCKPPCTER